MVLIHNKVLLSVHAWHFGNNQKVAERVTVDKGDPEFLLLNLAFCIRRKSIQINTRIGNLL